MKCHACRQTPKTNAIQIGKTKPILIQIPQSKSNIIKIPQNPKNQIKRYNCLASIQLHYFDLHRNDYTLNFIPLSIPVFFLLICFETIIPFTNSISRIGFAY